MRHAKRRGSRVGAPPLAFQLFIYESLNIWYHYPIDKDEGCNKHFSLLMILISHYFIFSPFFT